MKLDAGAVEYLLMREFGSIEGGNLPRSAVFDYPILYDETADMGGHTVLVPAHERPGTYEGSNGALFVCLSEGSAQAAHVAGHAYLLVKGGISFRRLYNFMQDVFVRNERLDARLKAYISTYAGFQPLLKACALAMECPFSLIDSQFRPIAQAGAKTTHAIGIESEDSAKDSGFELLESEIIDLFMSSQRYRHMRASHRAFAVPGSPDLLMKNIFSEGRLVGTLASRHDGSAPHAKYVRFLLGYLGSYVEALYSLMGSFGLSTTAPARVRAALGGVLAGEDADGVLLESALVEDGHQNGNPYVILQIERSFTHEGPEGRDYLAHRFELNWPNAYSFPAGEALYLLADIGEGPASVGGNFIHDLLPVARDNLTKIGISRTFTSPRAIRHAVVQAGIALERGKIENPENWCYRFEEYALPWMLSRIGLDARSASASHPAIATLAAYDAETDAHLLDTLRTFMACRYNASDAARVLFVARSTLLNRLERIVNLTGIDLTDADERLYLALSLALAR